MSPTLSQWARPYFPGSPHRRWWCGQDLNLRAFQIRFTVRRLQPLGRHTRSRDLTGGGLSLSTGPRSVLLLRLAAGHHTPCVTHPGKSGLQIARRLWFRGHRRGCCSGSMQGASGIELAGADLRLGFLLNDVPRIRDVRDLSFSPCRSTGHTPRISLRIQLTLRSALQRKGSHGNRLTAVLNPPQILILGRRVPLAGSWCRQ